MKCSEEYEDARSVQSTLACHYHHQYSGNKWGSMYWHRDAAAQTAYIFWRLSL
jgi:hypothetical protein